MISNPQGLTASRDTLNGFSAAGEEGGGQGQASIVHAAELVIDGGTLSHILGTPAEQALARVGAQVPSNSFSDLSEGSYV